MIKNKKYKIGFDIWGLIIFIVIMIPNFIWFAVPAANDILRGESITKTVDVIASICAIHRRNHDASQRPGESLTLRCTNNVNKLRSNPESIRSVTMSPRFNSASNLNSAKWAFGVVLAFLKIPIIGFVVFFSSSLRKRADSCSRLFSTRLNWSYNTRTTSIAIAPTLHVPSALKTDII